MWQMVQIATNDYVGICKKNPHNGAHDSVDILLQTTHNVTAEVHP